MKNKFKDYLAVRALGLASNLGGAAAVAYAIQVRDLFIAVLGFCVLMWAAFGVYYFRRAVALSNALDLSVASLNLSSAAAVELSTDAERWRAFVGCARIRLFGWSGFGHTIGGNEPGADPKGYRHFGAEFWTMHHAGQDKEAARLLTEFADAARRIEQGTLPGPKHLKD